MTEKKIYSLHSILKGIRSILEERIKNKSFWVRVEIANINIHSSGHCYLELTETENGRNIAKCRGIIWRRTLAEMRNKLSNDFNNLIKKGNEVLFLAEVVFSEQYGLSLTIKDVDITFSLGALEKRKKETIEKLTRENLLDTNKQIKLPVVIQRIAIVGSPETAGITDLQRQLGNNSYGYYFDYKIFPCLVQGDRAEDGIINQLNQLKNSDYDIIALVRGGGSKLDLEVFNSYLLAKVIAQHDKPVFTGIGHEIDLSVVDIVSNMHHKTPSALGSYIVEKNRAFEVVFTNAYNEIIEYKNRFLTEKKNHLELNIQTLTSKSISVTQLRRGELHSKMNRLISTARQSLSIETNKLNLGKEIIATYPLTYIEDSKRNLVHVIEVIKINSEGKIKHALENYRQIMQLIFSYSQKQIKDKLQYTNHILDVIRVYHPSNILSKGYAIPKINGELLTDQEIVRNSEIELELFNRIIIVSYIKDKDKWKKKNSIMRKLQQN